MFSSPGTTGTVVTGANTFGLLILSLTALGFIDAVSTASLKPSPAYLKEVLSSFITFLISLGPSLNPPPATARFAAPSRLAHVLVLSFSELQSHSFTLPNKS